MTNSTISDNTASYGGGIANSGTTTLYNTIIAKNSTDIYQYDGTITGSNNLIGDGTNSTLTNGVNGNIVGTVENPIDPLFVDPETGDYRLRVGSPAINNGSNALAKYPDGSDIIYDIVGNPRIVAGIVDIGAYEYAIVVTVLPAPVLNTPTGISASGLSLSWNAIANADGYSLQFRAVGAGSWISVTGTIASPQAITGLIAGTQYQFRVMAIGNGVTYIDSDWSNIQTAWTDDYVAVSTPYPAMMTQEGCSIYLQAVDIFGENLTYWWDLSGTGNGTYVQLSKSFWVNVNTLGFTAGEYTIRMYAQNSRGTQSEAVSIALSVVAPPATFNVAKTTLLNDQIVMLDIDGYFPGGRVPQSWTVNWGDSSGSSVYTAATTFVKAIYYYPQNTSDTTYPITLTIVNSYGTTETYFLGTHVVPGSVAPVESALPMLLSEGELFTPRHEGTEVLGENLFVANSITETIAGYSVVSWFDPAFALVAQTGWDSFIRFSLNEEKLLPASSNRLIDASLTDWFGDFIADEVADESIVLESINRQLLRTSESKSDRFDTQFDYFDTLFEEELIEYAGY